MDTAAGLMTDMGWWCFYGFFGPSPVEISLSECGRNLCVTILPAYCAATLPGRQLLPGTVEAALLRSVRLQSVFLHGFKGALLLRILSRRRCGPASFARPHPGKQALEFERWRKLMGMSG